MSTRTASLLLEPDVRILDEIYLDATRIIADLKQKHQVGRHLQTPKVPAALTESLAAAVVPDVFGASARARRPARGRSDLEITGLGPMQSILVAVKGTGAARWITVTQTDVEADALLWVDYTDRLSDRRIPPSVWVFDRHLSFWARPGRATFRQLVNWFGRSPRLVTPFVFQDAQPRRGGSP